MREEEDQFVFADLVQIVGDKLHLLFTVTEAVIALIFFYNPAAIVDGNEMGASPAEGVVRRAVVTEVGASCIPVIICFEIDVVVPDNVTPRQSDVSDQFIQGFKQIEVIKNQISQCCTKGSIKPDHFLNCIIHQVVQFLQVPWLGVPKNQNPEIIRLFLGRERKID